MTARQFSPRDHDVLEVCVPVATLWTDPQAPRDVDAPALLDQPRVTDWVTSMDAAVRKDLSGRTLSQLLLGEPVVVLAEHHDWLQVAALWQPASGNPRGYPGWVRRAHLGRPVDRSTGAAAYVITRTAACTLESGGALTLSFGTVLWVDGVSAHAAHVLLPDGRRAEIPLAHLRLAHKKQQRAYGPDDLLATARQFLGLRYLWGGTSAWGLDCSGLVHLVYRAHGVVVPRDARDQAAAAGVTAVPVDAVEPGDLYFFARSGEAVYHVGFASRAVDREGVRWMLHAPEGGELVEDAPMASHRLATLVAAGRVTKPDTGQIGHPVA